MAKKNNLVYQFKISLLNIEPEMWRRIQVPGGYTFWDLHVAIQDSMGWQDRHLHVFRLIRKGNRKPLIIGIPTEENAKYVLPDWEVSLSEWLDEPGAAMIYEYDFGDGWEHNILLEAVMLKEEGAVYPKCVGGERACPPEDCGGPPGYEELLEILGDPENERYEEYMEWLCHIAKDNSRFDPERFKPEEIKFDDPKKRWRGVFGGRR